MMFRFLQILLSIFMEFVQVQVKSEEEVDEKRFPCAICPKRYESQSSLNRHVKEKHWEVAEYHEQEEEEEHWCNICKRQYATNWFHTIRFKVKILRRLVYEYIF